MNSHLLRVIAANLRSNKPVLIRPSHQDFENIGNLTFDQLSNLRHRGAFTTVSQTFASCCQLVKYSNTSSDQRSTLLDVWYKVSYLAAEAEIVADDFRGPWTAFTLRRPRRGDRQESLL